MIHRSLKHKNRQMCMNPHISTTGQHELGTSRCRILSSLFSTPATFEIEQNDWAGMIELALSILLDSKMRS